MKRIRPIENWHRVLPGPLALAALLTWSPLARADIPPSCDGESSLITCAAADVGKDCQGGGKCYQVRCSGSGTTTLEVVYKCDACPTVLADQSAGCAPSKFGMDCGGGGTCIYAPSYCGNATQYICGIPATATPAGPPTTTGEGGASPTGGAGGSSTTTGVGGVGGTGVGGASSVPTTIGSSGGGCDVNNGAPAAGVVAIALIAGGLLLLALGRRRRSH